MDALGVETAFGAAAGVETGLGLGLDAEEEGAGAGALLDEDVGGLKKAKSDCCPFELLAVALGGIVGLVRVEWRRESDASKSRL